MPLHKLAAHVIQNHGVSPQQVGEMTPVELSLYCTSTEEETGDLASTLGRIRAVSRLTLEQRIELQRRINS